MEIPILKIEPKKYAGESTVVSMRMPRDMVREIDSIAATTGYTRTELMMLCLEFSLNHMEIIQNQIEEER
jgi:predicted transcriptional regulator